MAGLVAHLLQFIEEVMDGGTLLWSLARGGWPTTRGVRRDLGGFCVEAVGWCWLGPPKGLAATAVGMGADATGTVL